METKLNIRLQEILGKFAPEQTFLIQALHAVQNEFNFISKENIKEIGEYFNLTRAEVFGVATFYHDFKIENSEEKIKICFGEACQAQGAQNLLDKVESAGIESEKIFCLGLCSRGPAAMKGENLIAEVNLQKIMVLGK